VVDGVASISASQLVVKGESGETGGGSGDDEVAVADRAPAPAPGLDDDDDDDEEDGKVVEVDVGGKSCWDNDVVEEEEEEEEEEEVEVHGVRASAGTDAERRYSWMRSSHSCFS